MTSVARSEPEEILRKGEIFADRYEVEDLLGRGGMGAVYRVRDFALGEVIALKVLAFGPDPSPTAVLRFRQEVRLARRVTHPNVARVYDIGEHQGTIYLTMELIDGGSLRDVLRAERRLTPARTARIARALCAGLQAIHAGGVIHRDLKPANVLLDRAGRVVTRTPLWALVPRRDPGQGGRPRVRAGIREHPEPSPHLARHPAGRRGVRRPRPARRGAGAPAPRRDQRARRSRVARSLPAPRGPARASRFQGSEATSPRPRRDDLVPLSLRLP